MSTTELLAHEASISGFLAEQQEQGWRPEATNEARTSGFLARRTAALALAETVDLGRMSDQEFEDYLAA